MAELFDSERSNERIDFTVCGFLCLETLFIVEKMASIRNFRGGYWYKIGFSLFIFLGEGRGRRKVKCSSTFQHNQKNQNNN